MKKLRYILMLLLIIPLLAQAQYTGGSSRGDFSLFYAPQIWTGIAIPASPDWNIADNWSTGIVPSELVDVSIPKVDNQPVVNEMAAVCKNLTIDLDAVVTINAGKAITVNGTLTNNSAGGINIKSSAAGTGSLITGTVDGGSAVAERWMTAGKWNIVSSPLPGQTVISFLTDTKNNIVPTNGTARGMMDYNPASNSWNSFFTNGTAGDLETGKGFSMRLNGSTNAAVTFSGAIPFGDQFVAGSAGFWNCIGNPYTSAIGINTNAASAANFLTENAENLDPAYGAIYVWEQPDINNGKPGYYTVINNASASFNYIQQGQAFMVKMNESSVIFTPNMQIHNPSIALKSAKKPWPVIKLKTAVGNQESSTLIAFNREMTKGLDPTYDAGLLKGGSDLIVYSKLVQDNGIPFAIQALPDHGYDTMVIPIGLDFKTGGDVVFSAELLNLPSECKVILEDKLAKSLTDLSKGDYKVAIGANSVIADRFQLHTSDLISGLDDQPVDGKLNAYAIPKTEIRVVGTVSNKAVATLYNVQGGKVLIENLKDGNLNVIPTSGIKTGIYMLTVEDQGKTQTFKLLIRE